MKSKPPTWKVPRNLQKTLEDDGDDTWEDDRWDPILLTAMTGTSYDGRDIPLAWQIEFEPDDDRLEAANEEISALGLEPDGYGWSTVIQKVLSRHDPRLLKELHSGDTESATCVIWVESENTCKALIETVWSLIHTKGSIRKAMKP
jgi:hypothetical protein